MNSKIRNIIWASLLFLLCFPIGFMAMIASKPHTHKSQYIVLTIVIGAGIFIVLGLISLIGYIIAKKANSKDPWKITLIVFSSLLFCSIIGNATKFNEGVKERNRYDFLNGFRESMYKGMDEGFKSNPEIPKEVKEHSKDISDCIYNKFESNDALIEEAMTCNDPESFAMTSPDMRKIVEDCMMQYLPSK